MLIVEDWRECESVGADARDHWELRQRLPVRLVEQPSRQTRGRILRSTLPLSYLEWVWRLLIEKLIDAGS